MGIFRRLIPTAAQQPFTITISVNNGETFTLPLVSYGAVAPNFIVDWGDGTTNEITSVSDSDRVHSYTTSTNPETFTIKITGYMPGWNVNNNSAIRSKITSIVDWGRTGVQRLSFYGCNNLTSIPTDAEMKLNGGIPEDDIEGLGYAGLASVRDFSSFMRNTGITSIPTGLFEFATNATTFVDAFTLTAITSVPNNLFDNCTNVTTFASTFSGCTSLTTVPDGLFSNNVDVISFSGTFRNCISLTDIPSFAANTSVTVFDRVCEMFTTANQSSQWTLNSDGDGEHDFWNRSPQPSGTRAYFNCTGIATPTSDFSYADIPAAYK